MSDSSAKTLSAMLRPRVCGLFLAFFVMLAVTLLNGHSAAAAGMGSNSRLNYGNAGNYCYAADNAPGYFAKGMVWLSNDEGDYYSEQVVVATGATSVQVSIRGAANTCNTAFNSSTEIWAISVSTSFLSGLSGSALYRGNVPGGTLFAWSSPGAKLYGNLDVSGIAPCTSASLATGSAQQTISIGISRRMMQQRPGYYYESPSVGTEWVPVTVTRNCPTYSFDLKPVIQVTPLSAEAGANATVTRSVTKTGTDSSSATWEERTFTLPPGAVAPNNPLGYTENALTPAQQFPGSTSVPGGTGSGVVFTQPTNPLGTHTDTLANLPIGSQVCYALSVTPASYSGGVVNSRWRHSNPACVAIAKAPKIQISGGSLMVGRMLPAPSPSASIVVSRSLVGGTTYGSWTEYGAFAPGSSNIASGGNLASGTTRTTPSPSGINGQPLSFANNNIASCGISDGCYGSMGTRVDLVSQYSSAPSGYTAMASTSSIDFGTLPANAKYYYKLTAPVTISGQLKPGVSVILTSNSLITVTGDITDNGGAYNSLDAVPQALLLTSGTIRINNNVANLNAWLYAGGTISTCDAEQSPYTTGLKAGGQCDASQLVINGPVSASHLQLRRSYGADSSQGGLEKTAEAINLRADASLWAENQSLSTNAITTVFTQELPPRY